MHAINFEPECYFGHYITSAINPKYHGQPGCYLYYISYVFFPPCQVYTSLRLCTATIANLT